ncbi:MAG: MarR family transcriptional regulator [Thermodesulfobacteriota bacterium]
MNDMVKHAPDELLDYQARKLQELMAEMMDCCQDKLVQQARRLGLPVAEMACLRLFGGQRYLTARDIALKLEVAKSRVTRLIGGLMDKGLAQRVEDPQDGRIKLISLTPAGMEKIRDINLLLEETHRRLLLQLTLEERRAVLASLELLRASLEAVKNS